MPSFHEFDVALSVGVPAAGASSRTPTNEVHLNPWAAGTKGTPVATLSDAANVAASVGITMTLSRPTALLNAPSELVLGDLSGAWLLNIADLNMISGASGATLFAGVFIS